MRTTSTFKVGSHSYQANMWHPDKAIGNLTWLTKIVGEPILAVIVNVGSVQELMDSDVDLQLFLPAVKSLVSKLDESEVVSKVREMTEDMLCDGAKVKYDTHFMGRPGHLMKVLLQVLKAQYADFFEELPEAILSPRNEAGSEASNTTPAH